MNDARSTTKLAAALILAGTSAFAQPDPSPRFEVASVKPSPPQSGLYTLGPTPGGFRATNCPLSYLMMWAFEINSYQLIGGPAWISDRYDVLAKPGGKRTSEARLMLLHLLEDRFHFKAHREQREQTEYVLTIAKGGPKLTEPEEASCPAASAPKPIPCGRLSWSSDHLYGRRASMGFLVFVLSQALAHKVVDETGLDGPYDMDLRWTPDAALAHQSDAAPDTPPSLLTAVQEQMGLKLQPRKGLTDVVVVDHVERPTEN